MKKELKNHKNYAKIKLNITEITDDLNYFTNNYFEKCQQ